MSFGPCDNEKHLPLEGNCYIIIHMKKNIELLAPVGGIEHFFAAVENGADAVYLGGHKFNARIKADNFTTEELTDVLRYAHLRNVKVYVTVNTLLSDKEFPSATEYCHELYNMGVDAIIVQDLGLAWWAKRNLPNLPLHLSTQGTVYNLSGVRAAERLGFSRVVLARETTLDEINAITAECDEEIEMFVHGALCMCYSGQCQMSRVIGGINGRSANKGLCAQPCRLPYRGENEGSEYPLSPKDLCLIDHLGEVINAGVTSLKIEGRMKSPEYVAITTGIYRKYIDQYLHSGTYTVLKEDRDALRQIYSRGDFTTGYSFGNPGDEILSGDLPKHQGVYVGEIENVVRGTALIDVRMSLAGDPLSIGDGIEIRNEELTGNLVTYLEEISPQVVRIGDVKGCVEKGQAVYRTSQASLMKKARATYEGTAFVGGKCYQRVPIDIKLNMTIGEHPTLEICAADLNGFTYIDESAIVEAAINKPLEHSLAERQLRKTGSTCFEVRHVDIQIEENSTLPLSAINKLRREAVDAFCEYKLEKMMMHNSVGNELVENECITTIIDENVNNVNNINKENVIEEKYLAFYLFDTNQTTTYDFKSKMDLLGVETARLYLPLTGMMGSFQLPTSCDFDIVPYISNVSKGRLDEYIESDLSFIVNGFKNNGISIGNLGWCLDLIEEGNNKVYADYGLNLCNEAAKEAMRSIGIIPTAMSLECQYEGDWPIMITEHPIKSEWLRDRKNEKYDVVKTSDGDKWMIFKRHKPIADETLLERWNNSSGEFRIYISPGS